MDVNDLPADVLVRILSSYLDGKSISSFLMASLSSLRAVKNDPMSIVEQTIQNRFRAMEDSAKKDLEGYFSSRQRRTTPSVRDLSEALAVIDYTDKFRREHDGQWIIWQGTLTFHTDENNWEPENHTTAESLFEYHRLPVCLTSDSLNPMLLTLSQNMECKATDLAEIRDEELCTNNTSSVAFGEVSLLHGLNPDQITRYHVVQSYLNDVQKAYTLPVLGVNNNNGRVRIVASEWSDELVCVWIHEHEKSAEYDYKDFATHIIRLMRNSGAWDKAFNLYSEWHSGWVTSMSVAGTAAA